MTPFHTELLLKCIFCGARSHFVLCYVMYLVLVENTLGQDVTNPILKHTHTKKANVRIGKHATRKEGTVSPSATLASSDFLFPLPTSSLMQLFIFPPLCPVRAQRPGLLCSLVASGGLTSHMSFPTSDLMSTVEGNLKRAKVISQPVFKCIFSRRY